MLNRSLLRKFSSIRLSDKESVVFDSLIEAASALGKGTVLRAAGGWVRDKLLGHDSCDIDIALDNVPGDEFALFLYERERSKGNMSSIGVVKENPAQSKHIRTASFRFHGLDIDLNNLRSETYADDSRIPQVEFAKHPSEDALRRDFTMNALYYNLNTKEVEDFTGTGLEDLENGIVRTPLPAAKTFVDDPLRVLRAIRFATRYQFKLDAEIVSAWSHEDVMSGLMNKVSRERVGVEVIKMMKHSNALDAIDWMFRSGLMDLILTPPADPAAPSLAGVSAKDFSEWKKSFDSSRMFVSSNLIERARGISLESFSEDLKYHFHLSLLFSGVIGSSNASLVPRLAMKLSSGDSKAVGTILSSVGDIRALTSTTLTREEWAVQIGRLIRGALKELFPIALSVAFITDVATLDCTEAINLVEAMEDEFGLRNCYTWKPVVDGAELASLFSLRGPKIQEVLSAEFDMMFLGERDRDVILTSLRSLVQPAV